MEIGGIPRTRITIVFRMFITTIVLMGVEMGFAPILALHVTVPVFPVTGRRRWCWCSASHITDYRVCRRRIAIVGLRFDERMVYEGVRSLQRAFRRTRHIARNRPSAYSAEQVTRLWVTESGLRWQNRDGTVGVEIAAYQGISNLRFRDDEDGRNTGIC